MKKILLALTLALSLSSCGLYTKYEKESAVDANLYGRGVEELTQLAGSDTTNMMGNISWREIFTDPKLQLLIDQALAQNTSLRTAMLNVENARTALSVARLSYLPSVNLGAEYSRSGLFKTGGSTESYTIAATASWDIDLFGRIRNEKERSKMIVEQTEYVVQGVRTQLISGVANLYYTLSMLDEQIKITAQTVDSWEQSVVSAKALKEAGMMNEAGLAQIEAGLLGVRNSMISLLQARTEAENAMCSILAMTPQAIETLPLESVTIPSKLSLGVPMQLLSSRPDVMAAEAALAASFYSENSARSSFYPSLNLSGTAGWTNTLGTVIIDPAEFIYSFVAGLTQPIFNSGYNRAQLKIAKAEAEQAGLAFQQKLIDAGIEVNNSLIALLSTSSMAENYDLQVASLEKAATSTALLMEHGTTTYLEVLSAQQLYYNAQLLQVNNRFAQMQGLITLYTSLGGGR